jgi:hypothetical protein
MTERRWRAFHEQASCEHVSKESLRYSSWTETAHDRAMAAEMGVCGGCWMCGWGIGELRIFSFFFLRVIVSDLDASRWQPQPQTRGTAHLQSDRLVRGPSITRTANDFWSHIQFFLLTCSILDLFLYGAIRRVHK